MEPFNRSFLSRMLVQLGGVIVIGLILGAFVITYNVTYTRVTALDTRAGEEWDGVAGNLVARYQEIPGLRAALESPPAPADAALSNAERKLGTWESALASGDMVRLERATGDLEASLGALAAVLGGDPGMASNGEVRDFLDSLEMTGAEALASQAGYNEAAREYNGVIGSFPANLWAGDWGFTPREYFRAEIGSP